MTKLVFPSPESTTDFYMKMITHGRGTLGKMIADNFNYLQTLILEFLYFDAMYPFWRPVATVMVYGVAITFVVGFVMTLRKKLLVDDWFFILMCLMIILIPERQGIRFLLEAFPMYLLYSYVCMGAVAGRFLKKGRPAVVVVITILYLITGYKTFENHGRSDCNGCAPSPVINVFFDYVKNNVSDSDAIIFPKPRLLTLYTNKRAMIYARSQSVEDNKRKFKEMHVKYILPWYDDDLRKIVREQFIIVDSQVTGEAVLYRIE